MREREEDLGRYEHMARHNIAQQAKLGGGGVMHQLEVAEKMAMEAHAAIDRLSARLEPITECGPVPSTSAGNIKPAPPMETSQVGQRLEMVTQSLRDACARLDALLDRTRL